MVHGAQIGCEFVEREALAELNYFLVAGTPTISPVRLSPTLAHGLSAPHAPSRGVLLHEGSREVHIEEVAEGQNAAHAPGQYGGVDELIPFGLSTNDSGVEPELREQGDWDVVLAVALSVDLVEHLLPLTNRRGLFHGGLQTKDGALS